MKKLILLLLALILLAGCTNINIFGNDVIKISTDKKELGFRDVVVIKSVTTEPSSQSILPDQRMFLRIIIKNDDADKIAELVKVRLFNPSFFKDFQSGVPCSNTECLPAGNVCSKINPCRLLPGEEKQIVFELKSPTQNEIAGIKAQTNLDFSVGYTFKGSTIFELVVVNMDEVLKRQRAGETVSLTRADTKGSGPLQINIETKEQFMLAGYGGIMQFKVVNRGDKSKGTIKDSTIAVRKLRIIFPPNIFGQLNTPGNNIPFRPTGMVAVTGFVATCDNGRTVGETWGECCAAAKINHPDWQCQDKDEIVVKCNGGNNYEMVRTYCSDSVNCPDQNGQNGQNNCNGCGVHPNNDEWSECCTAETKRDHPEWGCEVKDLINVKCNYAATGSTYSFLRSLCTNSNACGGSESCISVNQCNCENIQTCDHASGCAGATQVCAGSLADPSNTQSQCRTGGEGGCIPMTGRCGNCLCPAERQSSSGPLFNCLWTNDGARCTNERNIDIFRGESSPLRFDILNLPQIDSPYKTYPIKAEIEYDYELRGTTQVTVSPWGS